MAVCDPEWDSAGRVLATVGEQGTSPTSSRTVLTALIQGPK